ncbi:MAG: hypothetical protein JKY48_12635, partial [Flavobacteriales bacterium]|nr:hypothetical protein [Flavobacteriales bacterium]
MNWEAISAIGEILGALAVVITLGYLALQIRHTRLEAADISRQSRAEGVREITLAIGLNEEMSKLWLKASQSEAIYKEIGESINMSASEFARVDNVSLAWIWMHWGQWAAIKTAEDLAELKHIIGIYYSAPPVSITWGKSPMGKGLLDEGFVSFVDEMLEEARVEGSSS